jgi:hypothetical protein
MYRFGKVGKKPDSKTRDRLPPARALGSGRDILRRDEQLRIAPKHPGMGRR